jgi:hypothetical protein
MKFNKEKFNTFLEASKQMNEELDIIPILYGSLGLNRAIGEFATVNDIDALIPDVFISERWNELHILMKTLGFELRDIKEHEFARNGIIIAFAGESESVGLIGTKSEDLPITEINSVKFKEFTPEQYLVMYRRFSRNGYRRKKKGEADQRKIQLIEEYLEGDKSGVV